MKLITVLLATICTTALAFASVAAQAAEGTETPSESLAVCKVVPMGTPNGGNYSIYVGKHKAQSFLPLDTVISVRNRLVEAEVCKLDPSPAGCSIVGDPDSGTYHIRMDGIETEAFLPLDLVRQQFAIMLKSRICSRK